MPTPASSVNLFVINPISGGKTKVEWEKVVREYFKNIDAGIEFYILTGENDPDSLRHWIERVKPTTVVAVGGDGTVSLVAKEILGMDIGLGILPAGSANGMARELNIPQNLNEALETIVKNKTRKADVIDINGHICLHLSDIGLNAQLIKYFEEGKLRGKLGYATQVAKTLWRKSPMTLKIKVHGNEVSMKALMVVLANARMYGTGAVINPEGDLYDGQFEVVIMKRLALSELFKMWLRPQPFNPKKIKLYPATSVSIQTTKKVHFQVDGEYLGKLHTVEAKIVPGRLKLVIP
ncbi:MAG: YegS/Rv2252/BmrU family lipid kinase [Chitinophagaceae bacterium]|nr:YegS/Rv2252/BmrU family lipid kinase [Chitinophagaceae bacterium]